MSFFEEDVFIITWRISSFSMCPVKEYDCIESPVFLIRNFGNSKWKLRLYPKKRGFIAGYLNCVSLGVYETSIPIFFTLSFKTLLPFVKGAATDFTLNRSNGYPKLIAIKDVLRKKDKYLPNDTLTVICQMKCKNQGGLQNAEEEIFETLSRNLDSPGVLSINMNNCCIETIIPVQTKISLWQIPRFDSLAAGKRITLPVFSALNESPSFYISLYKDVGSLVHLEIRTQEDYPDKNIFVRCTVSVVNTPMDFNSICAENEFLFQADEVWKLPPFLELSEAEDYFEHTDNVLYLRFDFAFSIEGQLLHFERPNWGPGFSPPQSQIPPEALTPTPDDEHPVVTFRIGEQTFKVHKSVLKARSEVFVAMFDNDMKEKATGVVDIPDVDPRTWGLMVSFLYLGSLKNLFSKDAGKLYAAAHKYQVLSLIDYSSYRLINSMTELNVCEILILADLYQDDRLLKSAIDFVKLNSDRILTSEKWKNLMENNLLVAANVMHKLLVKDFVNFS